MAAIQAIRSIRVHFIGSPPARRPSRPCNYERGSPLMDLEHDSDFPSILGSYPRLHRSLSTFTIPSSRQVPRPFAMQDLEGMDGVCSCTGWHAPVRQWTTRTIWRCRSHRWGFMILLFTLPLMKCHAYPHIGPNELSFRHKDLVEPILANKELHKGPCKSWILLGD